MKYPNAWYWDGSLRDISVLRATIADWQRVVDWLQSSSYPLEFFVNNKPSAFPSDVSSVFAARNDINVVMKLDVHGIMLHCHFFWHKEIEFDIDPRDVDTEEREDAIADFMRSLGKTLRKEVNLTAENWHIYPFLRYVPESDELVHDPSALIEPLEAPQVLSRKEGLRLMAKAYGLDEDDEEGVIKAMLRAANKPAYDED